MSNNTGLSFLDILNIVLSSISAVGSIATIITLFISIRKLFGKLIIKGELPIRNSKCYYINIYNSRVFDKEVVSISFVKGNPKTNDSHYFGVLRNENYAELINAKKHFVISKNDSISIEIPTKTIVSEYINIGEALGKPYDTIYIAIKDNNGKRYYINTHYNIDFFNKLNSEKIEENHG